MMRSLAIRLVLWLCRVFAIVPLDEMRLHMGASKIARSERWEQFYLEEGGLKDMLATVRREAFEVASEIDPRDTDKIYYWAMSDRNVRRLEQQVRGVIAAGKIELKQAEAKRAAGGPNPRKSV
jgi:hypothetical protein